MRDGDEMETLTRSFLDWHVLSRRLPYEQEIGDLGEVHVEGRRAFLFAIDALGHGHEAARVAAKARAALIESNGLYRLEDIFEHCHTALKGTRGAAMCLALLDGTRNSLSWLSVGNIQAVHLQRDRHGIPQYESLIMRGGVVGDRLPELRTTTTSLQPGDLLVLATDGVGYDWYPEYTINTSARTLATRIMRRHRHGNDDALVLVVRYNGMDGVEP